MRSLALCALSLAVGVSSANAAPTINKDYVRSLAAPGKVVLAIEYYDGSGNVVSRKGFASPTAYRAASPTEIAVDSKTTLSLYGVKPCSGEFVNFKEGFSGSCAQFAKDQLQKMLDGSRVVFCRAFMTEVSAPVQNATCYSYTFYPGSVDAVDMIEEQLVSLGALTVAKRQDGTSERKDLVNAEEIAVSGKYGMWADTRFTTK